MFKSIVGELSALALVMVNCSSKAVIIEMILYFLGCKIRGHIETKGGSELLKDAVLEVHAVGFLYDFFSF